VFHHRGDQPFAAERLVRQTELGELLFLAAHEISGLHSQRLENPVELGGRRRVFQVVNDLGLDAVLSKQADRLP
jgi:hypothetical protein